MNRIYSKKFSEFHEFSGSNFWHSAFYNYQAIVRSPNVDEDFYHRKNILEKVKKEYTTRKIIQIGKERYYVVQIFLFAPELCSKLRIF